MDQHKITKYSGGGIGVKQESEFEDILKRVVYGAIGLEEEPEYKEMK